MKQPVRDAVSVMLDVTILVVAFAIAWALLSHYVKGAEPARKPTLTLAFDSGPRSQMLRAELVTRDWLTPNPGIVLTRRQRSDLLITGHRMNAVQCQIRAQFQIEFVDREQVPMPQRLRLPAIRINRGRWESLDARAFAFETRPLRTLECYADSYRRLYAQDSEPFSHWCEMVEGFSGIENPDVPFPWEHQPEQKVSSATDEGGMN